MQSQRRHGGRAWSSPISELREHGDRVIPKLLVIRA